MQSKAIAAPRKGTARRDNQWQTYVVYIFLAAVLLIWSVAIAVLGHVVLKYPGFGRAILATGGNRRAAGYSGVKTRRIKFAVFLISGAAAALVGTLYSGMMQTARFPFGEGGRVDGDRRRDPRRHQPVRRQGHHPGHLCRRAADRHHQQRADHHGGWTCRNR